MTITIAGEKKEYAEGTTIAPVSYTHLTLPTTFGV